MPPQDPNMPEGTDSIVDGNSDLGGTAGSGMTGGSGLGLGTAGYTSMAQSSGSGGTGSGFAAPGGFDDFDTPVSGSGAKSPGETSGSSLGAMADDAATKVAGSTDVQSLKNQASDKARDMASQGKDKATEALSSVSRLVSETADTVDDRLGPQYGNYVRKAADALDGLNDSIRGKEVDELFDDARNLVRKSPAVAIGAAAAIGFLLVRLVKSGMPSSTGTDDDYHSSNAGSKMKGLPPRVDNSYDPAA